MGKTKFIELTEEKRQELENGWRNGTSHAFANTYVVRSFYLASKISPEFINPFFTLIFLAPNILI
jgi:hypothetical protein